MTQSVAAQVIEFHRLPIPLDRDLFARHLLREFTRSLEAPSRATST
jgi:hypothetical protein